MSFFGLIKTGFKGMGRTFEVTKTELEEFNREQSARKPFRSVKNQSEDIKHIARIARILVPDDYKCTHKYIDGVTEITDIIIGLMNATIDNPKQREYILNVLQDVKKQEEEINNIYVMTEVIMKKMYEIGLDRHASIGDKIRFILEQETEEEGMEIILCQQLPKLEEAFLKVKNLQIDLQKKGIVTY